MAGMRFSRFLREIFTAQSGISSKRVCGVVGWLFIIGWITYYIVIKGEMPDILETFVICTIILLGVDMIPKSIDSYRKNRKCDNNGKEEI